MCISEKATAKLLWEGFSLLLLSQMPWVGVCFVFSALACFTASQTGLQKLSVIPNENHRNHKFASGIKMVPPPPHPCNPEWETLKHWQKRFDQNLMGYKKKRKKKPEREVTESKGKITLCWKSQTHPAERGNFFLFNNRLPPDCCNRRNITKAFKKELEKKLWCQPWDLCSIFICFLFTPFCACFCQLEQRETPRAQLPRRARTHLQMSTAGLLSPGTLTDLIRTDSCRLLPLSESRGEEHSGLEEAMVKKLECEKRSLINTLDPPILSHHQEASQPQTAPSLLLLK